MLLSCLSCECIHHLTLEINRPYIRRFLAWSVITLNRCRALATLLSQKKDAQNYAGTLIFRVLFVGVFRMFCVFAFEVFGYGEAFFPFWISFLWFVFFSCLLFCISTGLTGRYLDHVVTSSHETAKTVARCAPSRFEPISAWLSRIPWLLSTVSYYLVFLSTDMAVAFRAMDFLLLVFIYTV